MFLACFFWIQRHLLKTIFRQDFVDRTQLVDWPIPFGSICQRSHFDVTLSICFLVFNRMCIIDSMCATENMNQPHWSVSFENFPFLLFAHQFKQLARFHFNFFALYLSHSLSFPWSFSRKIVHIKNVFFLEMYTHCNEHSNGTTKFEQIDLNFWLKTIMPGIGAVSTDILQLKCVYCLKQELKP